MILDTTTTIWRYGGQEIIQSPAGTINQANVLQLAVVCLILVVSCFITIYIDTRDKYNLTANARDSIYNQVKSNLIILLIYFLIFLRLCALIPAIVL
jgi:hypothetical protein